MYDLPSREDVGTVVVTEAVINDNAQPELKVEREPKKEEVKEEKADLKLVNKSA